MQRVLLQLSVDFSQIGYIQGLNYIVASIVYHSQDITIVKKISHILIEKFSLVKMYCFEKQKVLKEVVKMMIFKEDKEHFNFLIENEFDFSMNLVDWILTLGTSKVPLEFSGVYLKNLVLLGWNFFIGLLVEFLKLLRNQQGDQESSSRHFQLSQCFKNLHQKVDWKELITRAKSIYQRSSQFEFLTK